MRFSGGFSTDLIKMLLDGCYISPKKTELGITLFQCLLCSLQAIMEYLISLTQMLEAFVG
jgi:hypothetical protein